MVGLNGWTKEIKVFQKYIHKIFHAIPHALIRYKTHMKNLSTFKQNFI